MLKNNALKSLSELEQMIMQESMEGSIGGMNISETQQREIADSGQRELYKQFIEKTSSIGESTAAKFKDQMKLNDDYLEAVQKEIAEEGGSVRRGDSRQGRS